MARSRLDGSRHQVSLRLRGIRFLRQSRHLLPSEVRRLEDATLQHQCHQRRTQPLARVWRPLPRARQLEPQKHNHGPSVTLSLRAPKFSASCYPGVVHGKDMIILPNVHHASEQPGNPCTKGLELSTEAYQTRRSCFEQTRNDVRNTRSSRIDTNPVRRRELETEQNPKQEEKNKEKTRTKIVDEGNAIRFTVAWPIPALALCSALIASFSTRATLYFPLWERAHRTALTIQTRSSPPSAHSVLLSQPFFWISRRSAGIDVLGMIFFNVVTGCEPCGSGDLDRLAWYGVRKTISGVDRLIDR